MKPLIVVTDGFDKKLFAELQSLKELEIFPRPKVTAEELEGQLPKVQGLIIRSQTQVNAALLQKATQLKYVIRAGEGVDNIDLKSCQQRNIKVSNTPGANSNSAAEHAIALMFTVLRKTAWAHHSMVKGDWEKAAFQGNELAGKTLGVVGFGRIGQIVAKRLQGFEIKTLFYDPFITKVQDPDIKNVRKVDELSELFEKSDIVTMHMPYNESTHHMVNRDLLGLIPPHGILINASRGNIVDEEALHYYLSHHKFRGAGFDVFSKEPLPQDSLLRKLNNIILTPHLGASTDEAQYRVGELAVQQVKEFFINKNLLNEVSL